MDGGGVAGLWPQQTRGRYRAFACGWADGSGLGAIVSEEVINVACNQLVTHPLGLPAITGGL